MEIDIIDECKIEALTTYYEALDEDGEKIKIDVVMAVNRPNDDNIYERIFIVRGIKDNGVDVYRPQSSIKLFLQEVLSLPCDGTECRHSYDCCGRFYADPIMITKIGDDHWFCLQRWARNI